MVFINIVDTLFELINGFVQVWYVQPVWKKIHFDVQLIFLHGAEQITWTQIASVIRTEGSILTYTSGQFIATSAEVTPNGGLVRESPAKWP